MATCRAIVNGAYQDAGLYGSGETPSDDDGDLGLELLKSTYRHMVASGLLGQMVPRLVTDDYTAGENELIADGAATDSTITVPASVDQEEPDGVEGVDQTDRAPKHLSVVEVAGEDEAALIYDAPTGAWIRIDNLTLNDTAPLGVSHRLGLQAMLAVRLCPRFQVPVPPGIAYEASIGRRAMAINVRAPRLTATADYF